MLEQKVTVVTGAGSGVGRSCALRFARAGARVVCADLRLDAAEAVAAEIEACGGTALAWRCDVTEESDVSDLISAAATEFGRLDVMVNNVGIPTPRPGLRLEDHTVEDFDRLTAVNVRGVFLGCKHAVVQFKQQGGGGVIVNTGSTAGLVGFGGAIYGATKGAVHQLTKAVAIEGAPFGIRANAICPGGMPYTNFKAAGGFHLSADEEEKLAGQVAASHPLGRVITPEDCAEAAAFLASGAASNITGVLLPIDGGYVAR